MRKKIIVLGGSSGIGKATAECFAKEGCQVLIVEHHLSECLTTVKALEGEAQKIGSSFEEPFCGPDGTRTRDLCRDRAAF
jgi:NAD(P)-dependent dehydrogenase (short-subunit alcohol dehydrogenase family)